MHPPLWREAGGLIMDLKECLAQGLLKKDLPSSEKALRSLEVAAEKLEKAEQLFSLKVMDMALVNAYSSMFHASRALLFKDGYKERSHYALYVYLQEKYGHKIELRFLNQLNVLRLERHEIFYGLEAAEPKEREVEQTIQSVKEFLARIKNLL